MVRSIVAIAVIAVAAFSPTILDAQLVASATGSAVAERAVPADPTFSRDIAPILQQNCQACHRPNGVAPMALTSYDEVRPWAPLIKHRTGLMDRAGVMPPYYLERGIGIQEMQNDERLTVEEIATIAAWVDAGAPEGDPADLPPALEWDDSGAWALGEPDLVVNSQEFFMEAGAPDWWGDMESVEIPLETDRYVRAVAIREVNTVVGEAADDTSVGGRWIVHHMIWTTVGGENGSERTAWPVHELGRNPDIFAPEAGRLLRVGSRVASNSVHLHSSGRDTRAHLEIGFYFHPEDYEPEYRSLGFELGDGVNIDIRGGVEELQELHAYQVLDVHTKIVSFEPHLHGPGHRMCLEAIWGMQIETLNCSGYDHNWVKQYVYDDDHAPLLPAGTVLHLVGYMDMSQDSPNVPDPRNWQGSGNRSITNMFIDLGNRVALTDEQFVAEMARRREVHQVDVNDHIVGCPLCMANIPPFETDADAGAGGDGAPTQP
jgi:mono/diheme cytochrome c family protein